MPQITENGQPDIQGAVAPRQQLRILVRGAYSLQKLRIQTGNRIVANFRVKLGQAPGTAEEELDDSAKTLLRDLAGRYDLLADAVAASPRGAAFVGDEVIDSLTDLFLVGQYVDLERTEREQFVRLGRLLDGYPIWRGFLKGVKGIGPAMAGVLISEIDVRTARYASSVWRYAGLDVAADGRGRGRFKEHLVKRAYVSLEGEPKERDSITFNPFLKTKLMGVLAGSFLKQPGSPYRQVYLDYKHRLESHPAHAEKTKGHRHNMALRYMVKRFLVDLWREWRMLEGLPTPSPYAEAKLGLVHAGAEQ